MDHMDKNKKIFFLGGMALVLDRHKRPLSPTTPRRAFKLLQSGRARLHKRFPFTIRMVDVLEENAVVDPSP
ncbi:MAG: RRXRR domain-containing protein [Deltaproteobacteria bacterium]|jgi:hypothetical protein|nr:RRXRR domain-containing protein [Deltaproteobacteria bacterium]